MDLEDREAIIIEVVVAIEAPEAVAIQITSLPIDHVAKIEMAQSITSASSILIKNIRKQMKIKCIKNLSKDLTILEVDTHVVEEITTRTIDRIISLTTSSSTRRLTMKFTMMSHIKVVDSKLMIITKLSLLLMRNSLNSMKNKCSTFKTSNHIVKNTSKFSV